VKHAESHSVSTTALYFAFPSKYCTGGLMMVFTDYIYIQKSGVIDGNVTGYFECIINTMGCPPLNEKYVLETTGVSEVC
jgi:hypothetical protein